MARIRSIHPGLFTDEAFASACPMARILLIGLWCEADDQGVFEWKPLTIKMRILPGDNADVPALLAELADANTIRKFEMDGRQYGAVRNFRRFQRPKKPVVVHPLPDDLRDFVAIEDDNDPADNLRRELCEAQSGQCFYCGTEVTHYSKRVNSMEIDHRIPLSGGGTDERKNLVAACRSCNRGKNGKSESEWRAILSSRVAKNSVASAKEELAPQMEDGGGREGGRAKPAASDSGPPATARDPIPAMPSLADGHHRWAHLGDREEIDSATGRRHPIVAGWQLDVVCRLVCETAGINDANWRGDWRPVIAWLRDGLDVHEQIIPAIKRAVERSNYRAHEIRSLAYFDQAVRGYRRAA